MSSLSSVEAKLPPGFRFHPRDDELTYDYLIKWMNGCPLQIPLLIQVDLNNCEPWDIPETARVGGKEWYFYSQRDKKYATGLRKNRATVSGYWKATGKDRPVCRKGTLIGMRKTLVFYQGRAPKGKKTLWVMHEFSIEGRIIEPDPAKQEDWVLCRVFYKNRSESIPVDMQENMISYEDNSSPSLPPLTETQNAFGHINHQSNTNEQFHAHVPCFSNVFTSNQTSPSLSLVNHANDSQLVLPSHKTMPSFSVLPYPNNPPSFNNSSSCDKIVIETVLKNLTKMESATHLVNSSMKGSSKFGELGNSENYLSEIGMTAFMWNN